MKWARNIAGIIAVLLAVLWIGSAIVVTRPTNFEETGYCVNGRSFCIAIFNKRFMPPDTFYTIRVPSGGWFAVPKIAKVTCIRLIVIPHWLTNLIAWSAFLFFWRKARKPPKGHCQTCGYDLTKNESGKCPECGQPVQRSVEPSCTT